MSAVVFNTFGSAVQWHVLSVGTVPVTRGQKTTMAQEQEQFLDVVDRDTAERRWWEAIRPEPLGAGGRAAGCGAGAGAGRRTWRPRSTCRRSTARTSTATPCGPRTPLARPRKPRGACGSTPRRCATGVVPRRSVEPGTATPIATGGMLPRGADAVLMVEHARIDGDDLVVLRPVAPGATSASPGPTWPGASWSCAGGRCSDRPRDRAARGDRPGRGSRGPRGLAWRSSRRATRSSRRARRHARPPCLRRQRDPAGRRRARAGGRAGAAGDRRRRRSRRSTPPWTGAWRRPTWSC